MKLDFPSEVEDINDTDFDILRCLYLNGSLWKMEVTRKINSRREKTLLDLKDSISKQAVARRMERLHDLDYIENSIVRVKKGDGTRFILGYSNTEKGHDKLLRCVKLILIKTVSEKMKTDEELDSDCREMYLSIYSELTDKSVNDLVDFVSAELEQE